MIKALLLIFNTVPSWERILEAKRKWYFILALYLLPMMLLSTAGEGYGLVHWGKVRSEYARPKPLPLDSVVEFALIKIALWLAVIFIAAKVIQSVAHSFQGRQNYTQAFTCIAYGIGPLCLVNLLNAFPQVPAWIVWAVGVALIGAVLYQGLPRVMMPDPAHTLGLYFMVVLLLILATGLVQFLTGLVLQHQIQAAFALPVAAPPP